MPAPAKRVIRDLLAIVDMIAPPTETPGQRARIAVPNGPHGVKGWPAGAWDGGREWGRQDRLIEKAVSEARRLIGGDK